jgi:hypothetical protein
MHPVGVNDCPRITVERVMYGGQICHIEAHLDESLPHYEVEGSLIVYQSLGHLVLPNGELDHERQVPIGQLCLWMIFWPA